MQSDGFIDLRDFYVWYWLMLWLGCVPKGHFMEAWSPGDMTEKPWNCYKTRGRVVWLYAAKALQAAPSEEISSDVLEWRSLHNSGLSWNEVTSFVCALLCVPASSVFPGHVVIVSNLVPYCLDRPATRIISQIRDRFQALGYSKRK